MSIRSRFGVSIASCVVVALVSGCKTEKDPASVPTGIGVIEPVPVGENVTITALTGAMRIGYTLSGDAAISGDPNLYRPANRFRLLINGVDLSESELFGVCGTETYYNADHPGNQTSDMDAEACFAALEQNKENGLTLLDFERQSAVGSHGYRVTRTGSSGEIIFDDLQGITSALRTGENIITLQALEGEQSVSTSFFFFENAPRLAVTCAYHGLSVKQAEQPCSDFSAPIADQQYSIEARLIDGSPIASDGVDGVTGLPRYKIEFRDSSGALIDAQVRIDEDRQTLHAQFPSYPDVSTGFKNSRDISYTLTDVVGKTRTDSFSLVGRRFNPAIGLMVNPHALDSVQPLFNPMLESVVDLVLDQMFSSEYPTLLSNNERATAADIDELINTPNNLGALQPSVNQACAQILQNLALTVDGNGNATSNQQCALYVRLTGGSEVGVDFGFEEVQGGANGFFDIASPNLGIEIELIGYNRELVFPPPNFLATFEYTYLGGFSTTLRLDDAVLRGYSKLSVDPEKLVGFADIEEFRLRYGNGFAQYLADVIADGSYVPRAIDARCIGNLCGNFDPNTVDPLLFFGSISGALNVSDMVEEVASEQLPPVLRSFIDTFPLIGNLKQSLDDDGATQIVDSTNPNRRIQRTLTATYVGTKSQTPVLGIDNYAGLFNIAGGYELVDGATPANVIGKEVLGSRNINQNGYTDLETFNFWDRTEATADTPSEALDVVVGISANMINQFLATQFSAGYFEDNPLEITVNSENLLSPFDRLMSQIYLSIGGVSEGNNVTATIQPISPPQVSLIGGKESHYQLTWDLLFGLIKGGLTDPQITASANIEVPEARIVISTADGVILDAVANIDIGTNIHHRDGLPYLFVRTPIPPTTEFETPPVVEDKRLAFSIQQINAIDPGTGFDLSSVKNDQGEVTDVQGYELMKAQVGSRVLQVYERELFDDDGMEVLLNNLLVEFLENNSEIVDFSERGTSIELPNPNSPGSTLAVPYQALFLDQDAVEMYPYFRWFTVDESGGWISAGIDVQTIKHSSKECPERTPRLSLCYQE